MMWMLPGGEGGRLGDGPSHLVYPAVEQVVLLVMHQSFLRWNCGFRGHTLVNTLIHSYKSFSRQTKIFAHPLYPSKPLPVEVLPL